MTPLPPRAPPWLRWTEWSWLHPFVFAAFMPVGFYSHYSDVVSVGNVATWLVGLWVSTGIALLAARPFLGALRGGLLVSIALLALTVPMADHTRPVLFLGLTVLSLGAVALCTRLAVDAAVVVTVANLVALGLMVRPAFDIARAWTAPAPELRDGYLEALDDAVPVEPVGSLPDVWWILLDGHGRQDVLHERYGVTDDFAGWLASRGFYVASDARSNYGQTMLSLASTLNMSPIDQLMAERLPSEARRMPLVRLLRNNRVVRIFRERGYRVVAYDSEFRLARIGGADEVRSALSMRSEFDHGLIDATVLPWISEWITGSRASFELALRRHTLDWTLRDLAAGDRDPGPTLVLAHIIAPHPPFVFARDGSPRTSVTASLKDGSHWLEQHEGTGEDYFDGYGQQVEWLDHRMRDVIDGILARSDQPPIILLQGDHGPGGGVVWDDVAASNVHERLTILSAYRLPGGDGGLYPSITPVNSFRIVLNALFGASLPLEPDRSVFQLWDQPYEGVDVTEQLGEYRGPAAGAH